MTSIEYRTELFLWLLHDLIPTIVLVFVWAQLYRDTTNHGAYSLPDILQYYLFVVTIGMITGSHFEQFRSQQVREGKIDHYLVKPIGFFWEIIVGDLASKSFYLVMALPVTALVWLAVGHWYSLSSLYPDATQVLAFMMLLLGAYMLEFLLSLLVVLATFWFEGAEGMVHFKWVAVGLFSGWIIPTYLMPDWLKTIVEVLPFQYMFAVPISVIQGKAVLTTGQLGYFFGIIGVLAVMSALLWKRAMYKYASAGG